MTFAGVSRRMARPGKTPTTLPPESSMKLVDGRYTGSLTNAPVTWLMALASALWPSGNCTVLGDQLLVGGFVVDRQRYRPGTHVGKLSSDR